MQQLQVKPVGTPAVNNCATTPITTAAYVQLLAAVGAAVSAMQVFNTSLEPIKLAVGGAGAEIDMGYVIPPGTVGTIVPCNIPKGQRLSARSVGGSTIGGYLVVNLLG